MTCPHTSTYTVTHGDLVLVYCTNCNALLGTR